MSRVGFWLSVRETGWPVVVATTTATIISTMMPLLLTVSALPGVAGWVWLPSAGWLALMAALRVGVATGDFIVATAHRLFTTAMVQERDR